MNYNMLALFFLISISSIHTIQASKNDGYANCKLTIEIPEAWHTMNVYPGPNNFINNDQYRHPHSGKNSAAIIALKKSTQDEPCQVYLQHLEHHCQELYRLASLVIDKEQGTFSAAVKKAYYDHTVGRLICNRTMFSINGKLNEPVTFHINNVGIWLFELFGHKNVIPTRTINCTLTVK